ncbi:MAG TPA: hypothetical protein VN310_06585 [Candidatus Dormibacteraeota bacterium]|jgi:hypothetical protein|nr:hypothetical protein [Candidatus Dormibacteraeota bacterium]
MPWICPNCITGELHVFNVRAEVRIASDGEVDDVVGDLEWFADNPVECLGCRWKGVAGECAAAKVSGSKDYVSERGQGSMPESGA